MYHVSLETNGILLLIISKLHINEAHDLWSIGVASVLLGVQSIEVLSDPPKAFPVALPLQH